MAGWSSHSTTWPSDVCSFNLTPTQVKNKLYFRLQTNILYLWCDKICLPSLHVTYSLFIHCMGDRHLSPCIQSTARDNVIKARQGQEAKEINKWEAHLRSLSVLRCLFVWKPITSTGDNSNKQQRQSLWRCDGNTQHIPRVLRWMIDIAAVKQTRNSIALELKIVI